MNDILTKVNTLFTAAARLADRARPVSHAATVTLLGTSIYAIHTAAEANLPGELVAASTAGIIACEWLQWTALGRLAKLEAAADDTRANSLRLQCLGIGGLQVLGYTAAVIHFAAESGQSWGQGWALAASIGIALGFALLNFSAKFNSCEAPEIRKTVRTRSADEIVFGPAAIQRPALGAPADRDPGNVYHLSAADRASRQRSDERAGVAAIFAEAEAERQADLARKAAMRDPRTGQWKRPARAKKAA